MKTEEIVKTVTIRDTKSEAKTQGILIACRIETDIEKD